MLLWLDPCERLVGFPGGSVVRKLPAVQETQAQSLRQEGPLGEGTAPYSGFLAWEIPRTEDWWATVPGGAKESENNVATKQLNNNRSVWERTWRACTILNERPPHSLKWRSRPLGQAWEGSLEPGVSRSFKGINLGSAVHLNQGSDLGVADLGRLGLQPPLELCFTKTSLGSHPQLTTGYRKWSSPEAWPSSGSGCHV